MTNFDTQTSFVESVNVCLTALGERAVTSLASIETTGRNTVVDLAVRVIDEVTKDVEARGWWFQVTRGQIIGLGGGTSGNWNSSHPEEFRRYVTIRAARILQTRYITDETLHKLTVEEELYSKAVLEAKDAAQNGFVTFGLPSEIEDLGMTGVMFLQSSLEEKLTTLKLGTEMKQANLVNSQKLKVDKEAILIEAQELLVDQQQLTEVQETAKRTAEVSLLADQEDLVEQQVLTEVQETAKRTAEKDLLVAQELKVDAEKLLVDEQAAKTTAETALIADQEALVTQQASTEVQNTTKVQREGELLQAQELKVDAEKSLVDAQTALTADQEAKTVAEKEILESQKTKLDAETAYMITAEKNWFDNGGVDISGTVRSYKDFRPEMRIMGIQEAAFQSLPAYKKVELIKDANQLRTDRSVTNTLPNLVGSVNKVLRMLGVTPVSTNTNEHALASEAKELLEDTDLELQARGWWFNTEKDVTFTITSGKIVINTNTSLYEELDDYPTARVLDGGSIVLKNLKDNTIDQFSGTIKGTQIVKRSISSLEVPQKYREYLEVKVAGILAELYPQSGSEIQRIRKQEAELESYFKDRENDQGNYNIFDNYDTNERIGFNRNYDLN